MRKLMFALTLVLSCTFTLNTASATRLWLDPNTQLYDTGDTLTLNLYADIDEMDAIWGFGFDLSFDNGSSSISGPGESGSYLTFTGFTPNSAYFQYDPFFPPLWDDGDTIAGEVPFCNPDVWGENILLGDFSFDAPDSGPLGTENIYLGPLAGDYGIWGEEGLFGLSAYMPNNPTATAAPVPVPTPEPGTVLLLSLGMLGVIRLRKKM